MFGFKKCLIKKLFAIKKTGFKCSSQTSFMVCYCVLMVSLAIGGRGFQ